MKQNPDRIETASDGRKIVIYQETFEDWLITYRGFFNDAGICVDMKYGMTSSEPLLKVVNGKVFQNPDGSLVQLRVPEVFPTERSRLVRDFARRCLNRG